MFNNLRSPLKAVRAVLPILIVLAAIPAQAQESSVYRQLMASTQAMNASGYMLHEYELDALNDSEDMEFDFVLEDGYDYTILSVCDDDCDDVDLCLWDENDNEIECDTTADDTPMVEVTPKWTGPFTIQVTMYSCTVEPCNIGYAIFKRES